MDIGEYIKKQRKEKRISLSRMQQESGVALSTLYRIEAGNVPHLDSLEAIAGVLKVKPSTILRACGK